MIFRETGFRPFYHYVCALELNDHLRETFKNCPDVAKASHGVVYGYIDQQGELMLEVLGVGKQAPKYFYFKEPYEGARISIRSSEVTDVPFVWFENLEPRFYKKFVPRIDLLKAYDVPEDLERSRTFRFLDPFRKPGCPDTVRVVFRGKETSEECLVRITGLGDHVINGRLVTQPSAKVGLKEGDEVSFFVQENEDGSIVCVADVKYDADISDLPEGSMLKKAVSFFYKDKNKESFFFVLSMLRNSRVLVPCGIELTEEAKKIIDHAKQSEDGQLTPEESEIVNEGMTLIPELLENADKSFLPVFSEEAEMGGRFEKNVVVEMPFLHAVDMARHDSVPIEGIVLNAFTTSFIVGKDAFEIV